ncbi:hypothetical protein TeGR_g14729, partial [Tetraparma gracilis]
MPTTTRAQRDDGAATLCPPGSGNYAPPDPCACDVDGWVEGESMTHNTGAIGCSVEWEGSLFCYVQYDCNAVGVEMTAGGDLKWRYCEENEPEPVECQLCPPATASSDTSALPCTTCPVTTYANDDEGATLCAECPDDAPWTEEGATSLEECKEKPPSFMMAFDSIACENVARMVGRWDPVERTASGRWWYRHEDWRGEDGGLKSLYWDPDALGDSEAPPRWMFDFEEPSLTASSDLAEYYGYSGLGYTHSSAFVPPQGYWFFNCQGSPLFEMFTSPFVSDSTDFYNSTSSSFDCVSCEDGGYAPLGSTSAAECVSNSCSPGEGAVPIQDHEDPCACDIDGVVDAASSTWWIGCNTGYHDYVTTFCMVSPDCQNENRFVDGDRNNLKLYAYDFTGALIKTIDTPSGIVKGMAIKPGLCPELTSLIPPAAASTVERIHMPVMLRDRYGDAMPDSFDAASVASDIFASARGEVQSVDESLALPHTVQGVIEVDGGGLQAVFEVTFSGEYTFSDAQTTAGFTTFVITNSHGDTVTTIVYEVTPADPEAAFSTHNMGTINDSMDSFKETSLDLTLTPMDRFGNVVVDATDVT